MKHERFTTKYPGDWEVVSPSDVPSVSPISKMPNKDIAGFLPLRSKAVS